MKTENANPDINSTDSSADQVEKKITVYEKAFSFLLQAAVTIVGLFRRK